MKQWFWQLLSLLGTTGFLTMVVFFLAGVYMSKGVFYLTGKKPFARIAGLLLIFPRYMVLVVKKILVKRWSFPELLLFIFIYNSVSVYTGFISGFIPGLPYFLIFFTGLNIGLVSLLTDPRAGTFLLLLNPVAILEILAVGIAYSNGLMLSVFPFTVTVFQEKLILYTELFPVIYRYSLPLLLMAACLESGMIILMKKLENRDSSDQSS